MFCCLDVIHLPGTVDDAFVGLAVVTRNRIHRAIAFFVFWLLIPRFRRFRPFHVCSGKVSMVYAHKAFLDLGIVTVNRIDHRVLYTRTYECDLLPFRFTVFRKVSPRDRLLFCVLCSGIYNTRISV